MKGDMLIPPWVWLVCKPSSLHFRVHQPRAEISTSHRPNRLERVPLSFSVSISVPSLLCTNKGVKHFSIDASILSCDISVVSSQFRNPPTRTLERGKKLDEARTGEEQQKKGVFQSLS